jgi:putative membrane protein
MVMPMKDADHLRVSEAVRLAEANTSGEIVTIVADKSDAYHDVGLHYAILAMLLIPILFAMFPHWPDRVLTLVTGGWENETDYPALYIFIFTAMTAVFLIVRYTMAIMPLRHALTPKATRRRRVRRKAVELFRVGTEKRTTGRTGILIYLSMGEHMAEIVADEAIHQSVAEAEWGDAMAALIDHVANGRIADGMIAAVEKVGAILSQHLPRAADDSNELPDRVIEL